MPEQDPTPPYVTPDASPQPSAPLPAGAPLPPAAPQAAPTIEPATDPVPTIEPATDPVPVPDPSTVVDPPPVDGAPRRPVLTSGSSDPEVAEFLVPWLNAALELTPQLPAGPIITPEVTTAVARARAAFELPEEPGLPGTSWVGPHFWAAVHGD